MSVVIIAVAGLAFFSLLISGIKDIFGRQQQAQQPVQVTIHNHITNVTTESAKMTTKQEYDEPVSMKRW